MKAGFFFQNSVSIELLQNISDQNNLTLVGAYFKNHEDYRDPIIFEYEDELLVQIEIAYVFLDTNSYLEFTAKAIKRGVNVFLASLPDYSYNALLEINQLSSEIGVSIGFGSCGEKLIKQEEILGNYFILQLSRDTGKNIGDNIFRRMLIYDVASFVRVKPGGMRKLRVNGLPLFTKTPKAINLRLEYDNSSIISSSLTRIDEDERCVLRFFSGDDGYFKDLPVVSKTLADSILKSHFIAFSDDSYLANLRTFTQEVISKSPLSFGIENAIETLGIVEAIEERLFPMN